MNYYIEDTHWEYTERWVSERQTKWKEEIECARERGNETKQKWGRIAK